MFVSKSVGTVEKSKNNEHVYISLYGCCNLCNSLKCYVVLNAIKVSAWNFNVIYVQITRFMKMQGICKHGTHTVT